MNRRIARILSPKRLLLVAFLLVIVGSGGWICWRIVPARLLKNGEALMSQRKLHAATRSLRWYVNLRPRDSYGRMALARCLLEQGTRATTAEAMQQLGRIPDNDQLGAEARVRAAEIQVMVLQSPSDAERLLLEALKIDSNNLEAKNGLYEIYWWQSRRPPELMQWMEEIRLTGSLQQRLAASRQIFWLRFGEAPVDRAAQMLISVLRSNPQDYGARLGWAICLDRQLRYDEAVSFGKECLQERPDDVSARRLLGVIAMAQGDWTSASEVIEGWPQSIRGVDYWTLRGEYLQRAEGNFAEAIPCFERALVARPERWTTRHRMSQCLEAVGQAERARQERERGDKVAHAMLDTRLGRLLTEVLPNLETRPQGCAELADFFDDIGLKHEGQQWRQLRLDLEAHATSGVPSGRLPPPES